MRGDNIQHLPGHAAQEVLLKDAEVAKLVVTSRDCTKLMPDGSPQAKAKIAAIRTAHEQLETDLAEAEAKHRLYTLLEARTKYKPPRQYACTQH